ncbi:MAG: aconitase family protein, partial [Chloroflexota bacterium]|nr:aconitase family protein [Chloroflexota bacterium]
MNTLVSSPLADPYGARATLSTSLGTTVSYYRLAALAEQGVANLDSLPFTVRILLENALRHAGGDFVDRDVIEALARWQPRPAGDAAAEIEIPFLPGRVLLQDFTGVPAVVDLAAMRSAVARLGADVTRINPLVPADLVIDHSVNVDRSGTTVAFAYNVDLEYQRNFERYALLRWAQRSFQNLRVVPPGTGIVHQVNIEYLAPVVSVRTFGTDTVAFPDTLVGTDSHTTMVNSLGVLGWGVGGIEAEAVLLGQPLYLLEPEIVGVRLTSSLREGATATDLVLAVTEMLRAHGVVGRFVEFCGVGLSNLTLADRATISNMAPEYGATASLFPVDEETLRYLRLTGRQDDQVELVERYSKEQGLFRTDETPDPAFNDLLELDLKSVRPSVAGPRRPQDRVAIGDLRKVFRASFKTTFVDQDDEPEVPELERLEGEGGVVAEDAAASPVVTTVVARKHVGHAPITVEGSELPLHHGSVAIAAITSCTNTSNPSVMLGAGLLAKN